MNTFHGEVDYYVVDACTADASRVLGEVERWRAMIAEAAIQARMNRR